MTNQPQYLNTKQAFIAVLFAACSYIAISSSSKLIFLLPGYYIGLWQLTKCKNLRVSFYMSLLCGFMVSAVHLRFFHNVFQEASIVLWLILAFWVALFCTLSRIIRNKISHKTLLILIPSSHFIIEFFTCEIYPLKFTWLNTGFFTYKQSPYYLIGILGIYGFSYLIFILSVSAYEHPKKKIFIPLLATCLLIPQLLQQKALTHHKGPLISGIQLEFPEEKDVVKALNKVLEAHPKTDIILMSEYTFLAEVPNEVKDWCKSNKKYLICGSKIFTDSTQKQFKNSATVINPDGNIEFTQTKSVPIQFFNDGLPARSQKLWKSPWGKLGLCICYDLSYASVSDELVKLGAQALIVPTMDVISWGEHQHFLHSRVGPTKAAEYSIPIFKVSSSGISQFIDSNGQILASAPYPGQGETLSATLPITQTTSRPIDRFLFYPILAYILGHLLLCGIKSRPKKTNL